MLSRRLARSQVDPAEFHVAGLQFFIKGVQLFVGRFQLFLYGFEFLVCRLGIFVRRPQFFQGTGIILNDGLQVLLGCQQFMPSRPMLPLFCLACLGIRLRSS